MASQADELRRDFDASFALPARQAASDTEELLAIRVADRPFALRITEIGGVAAGRRVTPVPSSDPALTGLVGLRGALVPVFDLARLLGESDGTDAPRWVALTRGESPLALAFGEIEGHLRLLPDAVRRGERTELRFVEQMVHGENGLRPILSVPKIVEFVREQAARARPGKGA